MDEWVPSIALPELPPSPLEEVQGEPTVDEHGLPELPQEEPEETLQVGPARLYVGQGQRPQSAAALEQEAAREDYFVAELRLPRPEEGLPFGLRAGTMEEPDPWSEELALDSAEPSDPDIATPDLAGAFTLDLDDSEPPAFFLPPPPGQEPDPSPATVTLGPSPAREPLAQRVQPATPTPTRRSVEDDADREQAPEPAAARPAPTAVIHSKPSWSRARPIPAPTPAATPQFQARQEPLPNPWLQRLVSWPTLVVLVAVLVAATALLVRGLST